MFELAPACLSEIRESHFAVLELLVCDYQADHTFMNGRGLTLPGYQMRDLQRHLRSQASRSAIARACSQLAACGVIRYQQTADGGYGRPWQRSVDAPPAVRAQVEQLRADQIERLTRRDQEARAKSLRRRRRDATSDARDEATYRRVNGQPDSFGLFGLRLAAA